MKHVATMDESRSVLNEVAPDVMNETESADETGSDALYGSDNTKNAKDCLFAMVDEANKYFDCGYSRDEMDRMVNTMFYCCRKQVSDDMSGYRNRRSLLHEDPLEAALVMCELGFERMKKFKPGKANFATFMNTVFMNYCNSQYNHRNNDLRCYAESFSAPMGDDDDTMTLGDMVGSPDLEFERKNTTAAVRAAFDFIMDFTANHMSYDECETFRLRQLDGKSNAAIAEEFDRDKKSVENSYYRAMTALRQDAAPALNDMLQTKYGFRDVYDMLYSAALLKGDFYSAA